MKKSLWKIVALILAVCLLFTGCGLDFGGYFGNLGQLLGGGSLTSLDRMTYTRPDMEAFEQLLEQTCTKAKNERKLTELVNAIMEFYGAYDDFYTAYALAMIHYTKDLTDPYWQEEYNFCTEHATTVDAGLDRLYRALGKSTLRRELESDAYFGEGFFRDYEGESLYDDTFTALLQQEAELQNAYYSISAEAAQVEAYSEEYFRVYGNRLAELFVQLVQVRQQQAKHAGYDSYPEFAYDFYHARDYSVQEAISYMADVRAILVPLYRQVMQGEGYGGLQASTSRQTHGYVQEMAQNMGGVIAEAFRQMERYELYDIAPGNNKFDASYEIYLRNYSTPYIFVNPTGTEYDKLTFAHEFGHFCADYASAGSGAGVDVAEFFSQGMEYLSLFYAQEDGALEQLRLLNCLSTYVEQSAYASFEHQVYSLEAEELTVDNVQALYEQVGLAYGFDAWDWDSRDYVCITHFFISPMYVISYVISNDAAFQLYQMELQAGGTGLACLEGNLTTQQAYILAFLQEAQLESPFAKGRLQRVSDTLSAALITKGKPAEVSAGFLHVA